MEYILCYTFFGNTLSRYFLVLALLLGALALIQLLNPILKQELKKRARFLPRGKETVFLDSLHSCIRSLCILGAFYLILNMLTLPRYVAGLLEKIALFFFIIQTALLAIKWVDYFIDHKIAFDEKNPLIKQTLKRAIHVFFWGVLGLFLLNNLGFNISAVVTGLGIGGIAVALAAQTILGDLFNYFVIFFDQPFQVGDIIQIGDMKGRITEVGIKTTRLQAATGEEVIFPNSLLTSSRIQNLSRLETKCITSKLTLAHNTPVEKLEAASLCIRTAVESVPKTQFDRANWLYFGQTGFEFELVYYIEAADTKTQTQLQEQVNRAILERFSKEGLSLATPLPLTL